MNRVIAGEIAVCGFCDTISRLQILAGLGWNKAIDRISMGFDSKFTYMVI